MLFGWIEDEKYVDLVDESGKLFRRFKSQREYDCWASRFSPSDLKGLTIRESTVKWYDSNTQLVKLVAPVIFLVVCIYKAFQ